MSCVRTTLWLAFAFFAVDAMAQIGPYPGGPYPGGGYPPGRYPGGGYPGGPGIPMPGRGKQKKSTSKQGESQQLQTVTGRLRALTDKQVVVEAQDTRIINLKRTDSTKFLKNGDDIEPSALKPGDSLLIEATQDAEGFLYAVNVIFQKQGTA